MWEVGVLQSYMASPFAAQQQQMAAHQQYMMAMMAAGQVPPQVQVRPSTPLSPLSLCSLQVVQRVS